MTTVFVYEDVTATWAGGDEQSRPAQSLLAEGRAMLDAVTADFGPVAISWRRNSASAGAIIAEAEFRRNVESAEYTLVIAPETGGRLEHLALEVLRMGGKLLGPAPDAIRLTADKLALARHWEGHGILTPRTWLVGKEPDDLTLVIKPRDGAGSQSMFIRQPGAGWPHGNTEVQDAFSYPPPAKSGGG